VLAIELLATAVRNSEQIQGIKVNQEELKICQYADDTTLLLRNDESVTQAFNLLNQFSKCSGLKVNNSKSRAMGIGKWRRRTGQLQQMDISPAVIKILGVYIGYDTQSAQSKNISAKLTKMEQLTHLWQTRGLTLFGKVLIYKSLVLSQLTHVLINTEVPGTHLQRIEKMCFKFIWNGKPDKIARAILCQDYEQGGLQAPDIINMSKYFYATWIPRLLTIPGNWKKVILTKWKTLGASPT
jgi:Reverse transcriptase (RNA-dependent DNA polymerase)